MDAHHRRRTLEYPGLASMKNTHAPHKTTDERRIHWFGLASMSAALIAGLGFALGQHFFYVSLHGRKVPEGSYGMVEFDTGVSKQQVNTAIGTALAFAVKSCLCASCIHSLRTTVLEGTGEATNRQAL